MSPPHDTPPASPSFVREEVEEEEPINPDDVIEVIELGNEEVPQDEEVEEEMQEDQEEEEKVLPVQPEDNSVLDFKAHGSKNCFIKVLGKNYKLISTIDVKSISQEVHNILENKML